MSTLYTYSKLQPEPTVAEGTHSAVLVAAECYLNEKFQETDREPQLTLHWKTADDEIVYDSFIRLVLTDNTRLFSRLKPFSSKRDASTLELGIALEGGIAREDAPYRKDGRATITDLVVDGESVFGREALITIEHRNGWARVVNVAPPLKKAKAAPENAPS